MIVKAPPFIGMAILDFCGGCGPEFACLRQQLVCEIGLGKLTIDRRIMKALTQIRHLKFLRHTPLDFFNKTSHRRREWALVGEYERMLDELLGGLSAQNFDLAVQLAEIPEQIRGFDTVKDAQLATAKEKEAQLLDAFRKSVGQRGLTGGRD